MSSILRQWKNRLLCSNKRKSPSIDNELENIFDKLFNENNVLKNRLDKLEERYQQWINDERTYFLKNIEKLENENHRIHEIYQIDQIQNNKSIRSITNLIIKILLTQQTNKRETRINMTSDKRQRFQNLFGQCFSPCNGHLTPQELRKESIERHDAAQWRKKQQQDELITGSTHSISCQFDSHRLNDSRYNTNDQSIWLHQVKEQDQETTNYSSELNNHSSKLATVQSKSEKSSTGLTNKLYYALNNEKTPPKSIRDNHRSVVVDDSNIIPHRKQQSSMIFNKNQSQTRSTYSNHERLPTQTSYRTSPVVKSTPVKTTTITKPPRIPTTTIRPPITNTRQRPPTTNQKTIVSSSTTNKPSRPRSTLPKPSEPLTTTTRPRSGQPIVNKPKIPTTKTNNIKTRIPIITQQSARVTDLDALIVEQQTENKLKLSDKPTIISPSLFSKDTIKLIRPVRSRELKIFSCHLIPELSIRTNESLSTLTQSSLESITDDKSIDNQLIEKQNDYSNSSSNISGVIRDFSEDSLNEHNHIQKLFKQSSINTTKYDNPQDHSSIDSTPIIKQEDTEMNTREGYFLSIDDNLNPPYAPSLSLIRPKSISSSQKSLVHRLVFPARLGRMIFYRRILSDSDIYQKICSRDNEICHNVYHLDTIRDYSMEFYMLTTYASDSQLRAWIDSDDDEIVCHLNENRFQQSDDEINKDQMKGIHSSDSLIENEELDWYSELELFNLSKFSTSNLTMSPGTDSFSWSIPVGTSNELHSTPLPSDVTDQSNTILREILNHSWTDHVSTTNSIQQETGIEQFENDSTSSIITDEFQPDFYYLCPITKTTSFSKIDHKT